MYDMKRNSVVSLKHGWLQHDIAYSVVIFKFISPTHKLILEIIAIMGMHCKTPYFGITSAGLLS